MQEIFQTVNGALYSLDSILMLWIAGAVAFIFLAVLGYDSYRRRPKKRRNAARPGRSMQSGALLYARHSFQEEFSRRRRRLERERAHRRLL